ncbi:Ig-like domain-containing protein [Nonomuraea fuscirosea]|uniref:Ig-like domain-containing protein n=1 Tax=Nonomuraea fuscirosea TaxID=1291556 RepID=UPI003447129F
MTSAWLWTCPWHVRTSRTPAPGTVSLKAPDGTEVSGTTDADDTGTRTVFTPATPLAAAVQYTATVSGAQDIWENVVSDYSWTFTTVSDCPPNPDPDTAAPSIRSHSPAANAPGVGTDTMVLVTFCVAGTSHTAEISGASDAAGNVMTIYSGSFTTATAVPPDTTPPSVTETAPSNGAVDVALDTHLRISYNEPVIGPQITLS